MGPSGVSVRGSVTWVRAIPQDVSTSLMSKVLYSVEGGIAHGDTSVSDILVLMHSCVREATKERG